MVDNMWFDTLKKFFVKCIFHENGVLLLLSMLTVTGVTFLMGR